MIAVSSSLETTPDRARLRKTLAPLLPCFLVRGLDYTGDMTISLKTLSAGVCLGVALSLSPAVAWGEDSGEAPPSDESTSSPAPEKKSDPEPEPAPAPKPDPEPEPAPAPKPEPTPAPAENEYVPPPEAFNGLGGWAIVDPNTGKVYGVIVGNMTSMDDWIRTRDRMKTDNSHYMGCPSPCVARFQTSASADGNVAGWHGDNVRWDEKTNSFVMGNQSSHNGVSSQSTTTITPGVIPGDPESMQKYMTMMTELETQGLYVDSEGVVRNQRLTGTVENQMVWDEESDQWVTLQFPDSPIEDEVFRFQSPKFVIESFRIDLDESLAHAGLNVEEELEEPVVGDTSDNEFPGFVDAVRGLADRIVSFFQTWWVGPTDSSDNDGVNDNNPEKATD